MDEQHKKVPRKEIDQEKAQVVVSLFAERPKVLSPRKFIEAHFHALNDGRKVADIHDFLVNNGIDVGSLGYFRKLWGEVKKQNSSQLRKPLHSKGTLPAASPKLGSAATLDDNVSSSPSSTLSANSEEGGCQQDKAASTTTAPVQKASSDTQSSAPMSKPTPPKPESVPLPSNSKQALMGFSSKNPEHWWELDDYSIQRCKMNTYDTLSYFPPDGGELILILPKDEIEEYLKMAELLNKHRKEANDEFYRIKQEKRNQNNPPI